MSDPIRKDSKCPFCGNDLKSVGVTKANTLDWVEAEDGEEEGHFEDNGQGSISYTCGACGKQIGFHNDNESWGLYAEEG